ncbi:MAG: hypothetical protein ACKV2U_09255 [Bryobacteraceae bacterium]
MATLDGRGVAKFHDWMEVADYRQDAILRSGWQHVPVYRPNAFGAPFGLIVLAPVVVAGDEDYLGSFVEKVEGIVD